MQKRASGITVGGYHTEARQDGEQYGCEPPGCTEECVDVADLVEVGGDGEDELGRDGAEDAARLRGAEEGEESLH